MITTQIATMPVWAVADAKGHWALGRIVRSSSGAFAASMNGDAAVRALEGQLGHAVKRLPQATFATLSEAVAYFEQALA